MGLLSENGTNQFSLLSRSEVRSEESRRKVMLNITPTAEETHHLGSALISNRGESNKKIQHSKDNKLWCDRCQKPYHTKETCWNIHGKLADWKSRSQRKNNTPYAHVAETTTEMCKPHTAPFTGEQMEMLKNLFNHIRTETTAAPTSSSAHVVQKGNSFVSKREDPTIWIVDSGASDHMTGSANLFYSYKRCDSEIRITVADGSSSLVDGFGDMNLCGLNLNFFLYVPN